MMISSAACFVMISSLMTLSSAYDTCSSDVLSCIKRENGGDFPIDTMSAAKMIWNRDYSIVWYSDYMVQKDNLTCVTTKFGLFGNVDTYWNNCNKEKEVTFKTNFDADSKKFTISEYENLTLSAFAVSRGKYCITLYVCSETGVKPPHITVYCPTKDLVNAKDDIEAAKAVLTTCNINDGTGLCSQSC